MARTEARLLTEIWEDDDFLAGTVGEQRMFMYLLSQADLAHDGTISLRERRWSRDAAGLTADAVTADLKGLDAANFVIIDEDTEELLIRSFIRRDKVYRQPNVLRAAADHLPLVKSKTIRAALLIELIRVSTEPMTEASLVVLREMIDTLTVDGVKPCGNPSGKGSEGPTEDASGNPTPATPGERGGTEYYKDEDQIFPAPLSPDSETTPPPSSPAQKRGERGKRLPADFVVTAEMVAWAVENAPHVDGRLETTKFRNYWTAKTGKDATKLDWPATWRNWLLNAQGRASPPSQRAAGPDLSAAMERALAREAQRS